VRTLIGEVVKSLGPVAAVNGNEVAVHTAGGVDVMIGDMTKVQCILQNVIENAVKFTKKGHVEILAHRVETPDGAVIQFDVIDDGPGIDDGDLAHLFEQFSVGDDLTSAKYGGTGIGLALSNKLCHLMGGTIAVETEVGVGSRFTIRLPCDRSMAIGHGERPAERSGRGESTSASNDSTTMAVAANG